MRGCTRLRLRQASCARMRSVVRLAVAFACLNSLSAFSQSPLISTQPLGQTVLGGSNLPFSVPATGANPLYYTWRFNGSSVVADGTASVLTITNAQPGQSGDYSVVVSNAFGVITSQVARATVFSP